MNNDQKEVVFISFIVLSPLFMALFLALLNS